MVSEAVLSALINWQNNQRQTPFSQKRTSIDLQQDVTDCYEFSRLAGQILFPQSQLCRITYRDFYGDLTTRDVVLNAIYAFNRSRYFDGFCYLRNEARSFKYENIDKIEASDEIVFDSATRLNNLEEWLSVEISYQSLCETDFFVHPHNWGNYRRPVSVLLACLRNQGCDTKRIIQTLSDFCAVSMRTGVWADWYSERKAVATSLLALRVSTSWLDPVKEFQAIRGGKFHMESFRSAFKNVQAGIP